MREVARTEFYVVSVDDRARVLRMTRTPAAYASLVAMKDAQAALRLSLAPFAGHRLLLDLRGGPTARNDDAFEQASLDARKQLALLFPRTAVLVRSAVGKLQVQRLSRADGTHPQVFHDEAAAIAYLVAD